MQHTGDHADDHADDDALTVLALGHSPQDPAGQETVRHVARCTRCSAELAALRSVVRAARDADLGELADPPPRVWQRVVEELELPVVAPGVRPVLDHPRRSRRRPAGAAVGAGVLVAAAAAAALVLLLPGASDTRAEVALGALDGGAGRGDAVLSDTAGTRAVQVDTADLPLTDGFYEVWLLDAAGGAPVPLGALDDSGRAWLAVPDGVDPAAFTALDVSVEGHDGDPAHSGVSVLRGPLPPG